MAFEKVDIERMEELQERAEQGIIDPQMKPYLKWLTKRVEQIQKERERLNSAS